MIFDTALESVGTQMEISTQANSSKTKEKDLESICLRTELVLLVSVKMIFSMEFAGLYFLTKQRILANLRTVRWKLTKEQSGFPMEMYMKGLCRTLKSKEKEGNTCTKMEMFTLVNSEMMSNTGRENLKFQILN